MKMKILLSVGFISTTFLSNAQSSNKGYAITGDGNKDYMWMNIRQIDLGTGQVTKSIFDHTNNGFTTTDVDTKKMVNENSINDGTVASANLYPTSSFVAAAAFDARTEKLFFVPMRIGQLRWIDMSAKSDKPAFYSMDIPNYTPSTNIDEANNITRMALAVDNYGYAITNDGNHLYKFSTTKKPTIIDLGGLIDAESNNGLSVHNKCSSWGGDMIADAFGKLYIISAQRTVFVVDVNSRIATYKGTISGLPTNYTTNGAAVDADGSVVLSSAIAFEGYYKMNMADLVAKKIEGSDIKYNASDLASGNLLFQKQADEARANSVVKIITTNSVASENTIYPNPISGNKFNIMLAGKYQGVCTVVVSDLAGRALQSIKTNLVKGQQSQQVQLQSRPTAGTYLVKVLDEKGTEILSDKVVIL